MRLVDLVTAFILFAFFIGMTINHNKNLKEQKIKIMKSMSKQIKIKEIG